MKRASLVLAVLLSMTLPAAPPVAQAVEAVGRDMGYRLFGKVRKDRALVIQNSRPHDVQVFDDGRGVYVTIPAYSDREFACRGREWVVKVRFRDAFGDRAPFQVRAGCGQELQFVAPAQVSPVVPVPSPAAE